MSGPGRLQPVRGRFMSAARSLGPSEPVPVGRLAFEVARDVVRRGGSDEQRNDVPNHPATCRECRSRATGTAREEGEKLGFSACSRRTARSIRSSSASSCRPRARAVLQDAAFDLGGGRGRRGGELVERLATVLDAADDSKREGLLRVE